MIHKKRKKNASFGFDSHIQGRFRPFPACSGRFSAYFGRIGCRPIRPDMADTARFWPNQPDSARIEADSARIEPSRHESEKKKKRRRGPTCGQPRRTPRPASDAGAAPLVPRPCFLGIQRQQMYFWSNPSLLCSWTIPKNVAIHFCLTLTAHTHILSYNITSLQFGLCW